MVTMISCSSSDTTQTEKSTNSTASTSSTGTIEKPTVMLNLGETRKEKVLPLKLYEWDGKQQLVSVPSGGTDGESIIEIKENAKTFFASQMRCVTREDYQARILNLPAKFGNIAKAQVVRLNDISGLKIYTLSYDQQRRLVQTPQLILNNLWDSFSSIQHLDKKMMNKLLEDSRNYRNDVMHFRLTDEAAEETNPCDQVLKMLPNN